MNVADLILERARQYPGHTALVEGTTEISYARLEEIAVGVSRELRRIAPLHAPAGVLRVGLFWPNGWEYVAMALGILHAGACLVPIPEELPPAERAAQIRVTAPHLLLSQPGRPAVPGPGAEIFSGEPGWEWRAIALEPGFPEEHFGALNPAFVRFSSGTTGDCKGVVIGHRSLLERVESANRRLGIRRDDRVLWTLPMAHHFAVSIVLYLLEGATTVLEPSHMAAEILGTARRTGATVLYASPFHHALLAAESSGEDWPSLRLAVSTASSLREDTARAFHCRYGVPLSQGLGIIEAGLPLLNAAPLEKPLSVGRADDFEARLVREDGSLCAEGETGELQLRGPGFFDAYLLPWTERAAVMQGGWFSTGDLAELDAGRFVFIRGRRKSVINFGGMKFFPEEVEEALLRHPRVLECRVLGEPHDRWNQIPVAEVVAAGFGDRPSAAELGAHCREWIASYKVPVRFRYVEKVPRTASGKIRR